MCATVSATKCSYVNIRCSELFFSWHTLENATAHSQVYRVVTILLLLTRDPPALTAFFFTCMKEQYLFSKNADHNSDGVRHATRQDLQLPAVVAVTCKILGTNLHIFLPVWNGFIIHQGLRNILWTAHLFPQVQNTCASIVFLVSPFTF